jgi:hypothetical protein
LYQAVLHQAPLPACQAHSCPSPACSGLFTANFTLNGFTLVKGGGQLFSGGQAGGSNSVTMTAQQPLLCSGSIAQVTGQSGSFPYTNTEGAYFRPSEWPSMHGQGAAQQPHSHVRMQSLFMHQSRHTVG